MQVLPREVAQPHSPHLTGRPWAAAGGARPGWLWVMGLGHWGHRCSGFPDRFCGGGLEPTRQTRVEKPGQEHRTHGDQLCHMGTRAVKHLAPTATQPIPNHSANAHWTPPVSTVFQTPRLGHMVPCWYSVTGRDSVSPPNPGREDSAVGLSSPALRVHFACRPHGAGARYGSVPEGHTVPAG